MGALTRAATSEPNCDFGQETDPFGNGYTMTKYLVSLSQSQSCLADFIIGQVTAQGTPLIGQGAIPTGETAAGEPTHFQIEQSTNGNS
ncbi:MAG: hypothetical protein O7C61_07120, partial [SAR324 cluster bacterium]|nr:hypothetical protein [SAR324 cluster bacterium]